MRERSYIRLVTEDAARLLQAMGTAPRASRLYPAARRPRPKPAP